jgi:hypothetical protein
MLIKYRNLLFTVFALLLVLVGTSVAYAWTPKAVTSDPLARMPGTQPNAANNIEDPSGCNCHESYDTSVEPFYNWQGSMMAQSARDFLFWSCMTVAGQDSIWAIGTPNAVDICERCHFPKGWLEGRSDPPNASDMTGADYDGVQCAFCHRMWDPFFESVYAGTREGNDWLNYWDETNLASKAADRSQVNADATLTQDRSLTGGITLFNTDPFFSSNLPPVNYLENGAGQYFVDFAGDRRASFADATPAHQKLYSRYHKSKYFCSTCHDVSNPVLANLSDDPDYPLTTETDSAYSYYHVERTFSEFMLSAYGAQGGAAGIGPYAPGSFTTSLANNYISRCQDCHMEDVVGKATNTGQAILRPTNSVEHPNSGQPLHDLTGGNMWVSAVLASAVSGSPNYDATNDGLLNQGAAALTLDLNQGLGINAVALIAGSNRAQQQLLQAAAIQNASYDPTTGDLTFQVQNQTGHKLISGFPEGRRMFVNIKVYQSSSLVYEVNPYDATAGTLKGLPLSYSPNSPALSANERHMDALVYEMHPTSYLTGETETFHFALATGRYKDNRIPPKGFDLNNAAARLSEPVWHGVSDVNYFTEAEYAGGYDEVTLTGAEALPANAGQVVISLYYQTTSREYIEFLRDEINGTGGTLTDPGAGGDQAYLIQTDSFFSQLRAWGNTIWQLWDHNKNLPGAAPVLMVQADAPLNPTAVLLGDVSLQSVSDRMQIEWQTVLEFNVLGFNLYRSESIAGQRQKLNTELIPAQLSNTGASYSFEDSGLSAGERYYYWIEVVEISKSSLFGPYSAVALYNTYIPVLIR